MRKAAIALTVGAVVFAGGAGYIRLVMVPDAEQVQSDTHTVNHYAGTASYLDTQAVASADFAHAFAKDVPFTAVEDYKTAKLYGQSAVITDATTTSGDAAAALGNSSVNWAVDRKSLMPVPGPSGIATTDHAGLVVGFPFAPSADDYPWWDTATAKAATAKYVKTENHAGRTAYRFEVNFAGTLVDKGIKDKLPASVQAEVLKGLAATVAPDQASALALLLPKGGGDVPLSYTSKTTTTMWVDKVSGTTIDAESEQTVTAQLKSSLGMVPLTPVLDVKTKYTPQGVADAVKQSKDDESRLFWEGTFAPGALGLVALILAIAAWVFWRRRGAAAAVAAADGVDSEGGVGAAEETDATEPSDPEAEAEPESSSDEN